MFSFLREIMAPTTRSASAQQQQEQDDLQTKDDFEEIVHTMEEFTSAAAEAEVAAPNVAPAPAALKGFKITDNERSKKYGLGANSLQMLKTKAKLKFPVSITMKNLPLQTNLLCVHTFSSLHFYYEILPPIPP